MDNDANEQIDASQDVTTEQSSDSQEQPSYNNDPALLEENKRLKGTAAALQKKYLDSTRQKGQQTAPQDGSQNDNEVFSTAFDLALAKVRNGLEDVLPLYDGSNPGYEGEPSLPPEDIARIRKNPLAFVSATTLKQYFMDGNEQPLMLEIEQHMADRADALTAQSKVGSGKEKQVNPSPAPEAQQQPQQGSQDLWTMPIDDLEQIKDKQVAAAQA